MKLLLESSDNFVPQLVTVGNNLKVVAQATTPLDCSNLTWVSPVSILPIAATIHQKNLAVQGIKPYLTTVSFPNGIDDPDLLPTDKTYLPIIRFPTNSENITEKITTGFLDWFCDT